MQIKVQTAIRSMTHCTTEHNRAPVAIHKKKKKNKNRVLQSATFSQAAQLCLHSAQTAGHIFMHAGNGRSKSLSYFFITFLLRKEKGDMKKVLIMTTYWRPPIQRPCINHENYSGQLTASQS